MAVFNLLSYRAIKRQLRSNALKNIDIYHAVEWYIQYIQMTDIARYASKIVCCLNWRFQKFLLSMVLVNLTDYDDSYGAKNHLHKISFHLSLLGPSKNLLFQRSKIIHGLITFDLISIIIRLVKPTNYVDPFGTLHHLHKIPFHLSLLGSSETL